MLSQKRLKEVIRYNPKTGEFIWRLSRGCKTAGKCVGWNSNGYVMAKIDKEVYPLHRLAFLYMVGELPDPMYDVDHINGIKNDNRFDNLRVVDRETNALNTKTNSNNELGCTNVRMLKDTGKYQVRVRGVSYGCYRELEEAEEVASYVLNKELQDKLLQMEMPYVDG